MAKTPPNPGNPWSKREDATLKQYAKENTPTRVIALKMGRLRSPGMPRRSACR